MTKARREYQPALCNEISDVNLQDLCLQMAGEESKNYYFQLAKTEGDSKWCEFIPEQQARSSCVNIVASS